METLIAAIIIAIISVVIVLLVTRSKKKKWRTQKKAINLLITLRSLIAFTQKHRGMCASYIQGTTSASAEIRAIKKSLSPIISDLKHNSIINRQERWIGYMDHWNRLSNQATQLTVEESFNQHTSLIVNLLYLFEDIAEQQKFDRDTIKGCPNIDLLWQALPFTCEYIGQSRAIGVAIVARGESTQVDKVKLGYLEKKVSQLSQKVFSQFESKQVEHIQMLSVAKDLCQSFTLLMRTDLLEVQNVSISTATYFEAASLAMDAINRLLDVELQGLKDNVSQSF